MYDPIVSCLASREILVDGQVAFAFGERLVIEKIDPNLEMPQYKYVVFSQKLNMRFQLSDADITVVELPAAGRDRNKVALLLAAGLAALAIAVVVTFILLAGGGPGGGTAVNTGAVVCIDAGHGGSDTGALENGVAEKDVNLDIALRARQLLSDRGYRVVMTRESDVPVTLARRCAIAQDADAEVLVSIHNNSRPPDVQGTTTYYFRDSTQGMRLAALIQSQVASRIKRPDRGLRGSRLYVVRNVDMPSALLEGVFLSNAEEAKLIGNAAFRQRIAEGVAAGIESYLQNP